MNVPTSTLPEASSEEISVLVQKTMTYLGSRKNDIWYDAILRFLNGKPSCPKRKRNARRHTYSAQEYEALSIRLTVYLFQTGNKGKEAFARYRSYLQEAERMILHESKGGQTGEFYASSKGMSVGDVSRFLKKK
jgi:hypothetical protein